MIDRDCTACVFCDGSPLAPLFEMTLLGRAVAWARCSRCGSIQINRVDWLEEAYRDLAVNIDAGCAQRSILCAIYVRAMRGAGLVGRRAKIVDFGAGNGLLVRLLRDMGFDAYGHDRYVRPADCAGFTIDSLDGSGGLGAGLVTAIDVLEHLPYPRRTLADVAANLGPRGLVLLRTPLYDPGLHGADWEHLGPEHGQHISFATRVGLALLAESAGLTAQVLPMNFILLSRPGAAPGPVRRAVLTGLAGLYVLRARGAGLCRFDHAANDMRTLLGRGPH